jgi:hypothetical protein
MAVVVKQRRVGPTLEGTDQPPWPGRCPLQLLSLLGAGKRKGQWVGTYQAKSRSQEEPGHLHQGPWPIANHVLNVVVETVCSWPGRMGGRENQRVRKLSGCWGRFTPSPP